MIDEDLEPDLDDLEDPELDEIVDEDLADLLEGIEDDEYTPEPWESLEELAEAEDRFDPWAASGVQWDDPDA